MNKDLQAYVKLLSDRDTKTLEGRSLKTTEETGELAKKVLAHTQSAGSLHRFVTATCVLEECADVMLSAISAAYKLGFSQEDLESMMMQKAQKWDSLQERELGTKYPLPYEIHITVEHANIEDFKTACASLGVKPILLALQIRASETVLHDVMTSSTHLGDNTTAVLEMNRIAGGLEVQGFKVVRRKIETVPWHPAAPSDKSGVRTMPAGTYFESHLNILVVPQSLMNGGEKHFLESVASRHGAHLSKNAFKQYSETEYTLMMTLRSHQASREEFEQRRDALTNELKQHNFELEKVITEFAIYDSKNNHDNAWLLAN